MKVSIIVPYFNEEQTLPTLLGRVEASIPPEIEAELILVDDGSTDGSGRIADDFAGRRPDWVHSLHLPSNRGKGRATRTGLELATGEVCLIQDADLEYDPAEYRSILAVYRDPATMVVYGSRILGGRNRSYRRYYWGGRLVTWFTNLLYGCRITDEPTGFKSFRRRALDGLSLRSDGFEFCAELTAKLLRARHRIVEVPIGYRPRSFREGKKIRPSDGLRALWTLLRLRLGGR